MKLNFFVGDTKPIQSEWEIRADEVTLSYVQMIDDLKSMGVSYRKTTMPTALSYYVKHGVHKLSGQKFTEGVFEVVDVPKSKGSRSFNTRALLHPDFSEYKNKLERMGYTVVIDTSMEVMGMGAYHWSVTNVIALKPNSTWVTFLHEFQHAEFNKYVKPIFPQLTRAAKFGEDIDDVVKRYDLGSIGTKRLKRLKKLVERGLPETAVNETLSGDEELKALGFRRYLPFLASSVRQYALRHQITELEKLETILGLTETQKKTLARARRRLALQRVYQLAARKFTSPFSKYIAPSVGALSLSHEHGREGEDYVQYIYKGDSKVPFAAQKKNGQWLRFKSLPYNNGH